MGKSVRINVSLPEQLQAVFGEVAERTGVSLPQVLVNALAQQAAYARRWMATWDYRPREVASSPVDHIGAEASVDGGGVSAPVRPVKGKGSSGLSRQQRRAQQRLLRKTQRVA